MYMSHKEPYFLENQQLLKFTVLRPQLVTMLYISRFTDLPVLDFIIFVTFE